MTEDQLKEIIILFTLSLRDIGRAITYDDQNKSQALDAISRSNKCLDKIQDIVIKK